MALRKVIFRVNSIKNLALNYCKPVGLDKDTSWVPKDEETHTGQKFDENDYRLVRFIDKTKHINPNWGVKLIAEIPPSKSTCRVVSCDGGGGPTGHPKVFINLDKPGTHACNYCGLRFEKVDREH